MVASPNSIADSRLLSDNLLLMLRNQRIDPAICQEHRLILKNTGLPQAGELFDRAYAYIRENYQPKQIQSITTSIQVAIKVDSL